MKSLFSSKERAEELELAKVRVKAGILLELYSLYDRKACTYAPPFVAQNDGLAARMILASAQNADSLLANFPGDFDLYHLGQMSPDRGLFVQDEVRHVGNVSAILEAAMRSYRPVTVQPSQSSDVSADKPL